MKKGIFFIVQSFDNQPLAPVLSVLCTVSIEKRPKQRVDVYQTQQSSKLSVSARIHLFLAQCSLLISNSQSTRFCQSQKHNKTCLLVPNRAFRATADSTNLRNIENRAFQHEIAHFMSKQLYCWRFVNCVQTLATQQNGYFSSNSLFSGAIPGSSHFCQSQKHKTCLSAPNRTFRATADFNPFYKPQQTFKKRVFWA